MQPVSHRLSEQSFPYREGGLCHGLVAYRRLRTAQIERPAVLAQLLRALDYRCTLQLIELRAADELFVDDIALYSIEKCLIFK